METWLQFQAFLCNGDEKVDDDGHPDLGLHGVGRSAVEGLDPQMPLDPFEEQFHLPPLLVDIGNGLRRDGEQVGQKHKAPMVLSVVESDAAQRLRVILSGLGPHQRDDLIDADPASLVHRGRRQASEAQIPFGADHEESRKAMDSVETLEVEISTIHCDHRLLFQRHHVQEMDVVHRPRKSSLQRSGSIPANPEAYAFSRRPSSFGTLPRGKGKGTKRSSWGPARRGNDPIRRPVPRTGTTSGRFGRANSPPPRRSGSRVSRWCRPVWSGRSFLASRRGRVSRDGTKGKPRYRAKIPVR